SCPPVTNVLAAVVGPLAPRAGVSEERSCKAARALMSKVRISPKPNYVIDPEFITSCEVRPWGCSRHIVNIFPGSRCQFETASAEKLSCEEEVTRSSQTVELANRPVLA
ncbi:hypothetical protein D4764_10G0003700, partial [Takifugu flavidus]